MVDQPTLRSVEIDVNPAQPKVTYATMSADQMSDLHRELDAAIERVKDGFGQSHPMFVDGRAVEGSARVIEDRSPIDTRILIGRFTSATREQTQDAIAAARAAFPAWSRRPWEERVQIVRRDRPPDSRAPRRAVGAGRLRDRQEPPRVRRRGRRGRRLLRLLLRPDGADRRLREPDGHAGFRRGEPERPPPVRRLRRSSRRSTSRWRWRPARRRPRCWPATPSSARPPRTPRWRASGSTRSSPTCVPPGVFNLVNGPGVPVGQEIADNPGVDGLVFTGSMAVGTEAGPRQRVAPVPAAADHRDGREEPRADHAAAPISTRRRTASCAPRSGRPARSARPARASTCRARCGTGSSSCSSRRRRRSRSATRSSATSWMGPVINERALKNYENAIERAKRDGGRILTGGRRIMDEPFNHGYFVEPTVIDGLPPGHALFKEELFVPIVVVADVLTLDEAIDLANETEYGLTAGIFSQDEAEIERVLRPDPGGRDLRQPARRRDDRGVAGAELVRRLEGERIDGPGHWRPALPAAVLPRAEPDARSVAAGSCQLAAVETDHARPCVEGSHPARRRRTMAATKVMPWGRGLVRATLIGTVLQLAMVVAGHYDAAVAKLFAAMGMLLSLVAGFLAGRWSAGLGKAGAAVSGLVAGAACAFIGILESFYLGDVPAWVIGVRPVQFRRDGSHRGLPGADYAARTHKRHSRSGHDDRVRLQDADLVHRGRGGPEGGPQGPARSTRSSRACPSAATRIARSTSTSPR